MSVQETSTDAQDDLVVQVRVNGESRRGFAEPRTLLSDFLRHELGLTGTHVGCEHGVCGACTVLIDGEPVRSCLMFAVQAGGKEIETVEGLAKGAEMHPIQQAFQENHALQCAFCTPGFLMTVSALLDTNPDPSEDEIREYLSGNVCRCTGYVGIVAAVQSAAKKLRDQGGTADER
ncbi:MAG: carbon monoxide dehydrogenase small chain [Conexibacter sp.]|jgi:carbon-monoxide dehydrogenase small subunit|nr:carbon monoxide dehydrogenase small chain [Conexibacter sp.]MDX6717324.1 aerobic carbon-monoxide dehydrogenase small subunit [Baekduia sp.]MDX6731269.1 aerobic carbon-monoxide dehydrogenase small subunit [Baekduia sp.]